MAGTPLSLQDAPSAPFAPHVLLLTLCLSLLSTPCSLLLRSYLSGVGFDPVYGARPVKRAVQRELETPLAKALLTGAFQEEDTVIVDASPSGSGLCFARRAAVAADGEGAGEGGAAAAAAQEEVPVVIPAGGYQRPVPVLAAAAATPAASTSGGGAAVAAGGKRFDPLAGGRKGSKSSQQAPIQQQQPNGSASEGPGTAPAAEAGAADGSSTGGGGGSSSGTEGLDAAVAARLDTTNLPSFLKDPVRRDGQDMPPTCSE